MTNVMKVTVRAWSIEFKLFLLLNCIKFIQIHPIPCDVNDFLKEKEKLKEFVFPPEDTTE